MTKFTLFNRKKRAPKLKGRGSKHLHSQCKLCGQSMLLQVSEFTEKSKPGWISMLKWRESWRTTRISWHSRGIFWNSRRWALQWHRFIDTCHSTLQMKVCPCSLTSQSSIAGCTVFLQGSSWIQDSLGASDKRTTWMCTELWHSLVARASGDPLSPQRWWHSQRTWTLKNCEKMHLLCMGSVGMVSRCKKFHHMSQSFCSRASKACAILSAEYVAKLLSIICSKFHVKFF